MIRPQVIPVFAIAFALAGCAEAPRQPVAAPAAAPAPVQVAPAPEPTPAPEPKPVPKVEPAAPELPKGTPALSTGIKAYEDGKFAAAAKTIQSALDQGLNESDQVRAHKLLAFMHCIGGREAACRTSFQRALKIDPRMELSAAEAGHPGWGPVFKSVKKAAAAPTTAAPAAGAPAMGGATRK